jgi:hypothetical protein
LVYTSEFRLSITKALSDQLAAEIALLKPVPLTAENVANVEARGGVYQLFRDGALVYIGKADRSVADRLRTHRRKIQGRVGLDLDEMSFVALYVDEDLSAVAPERLLIGKHRGKGESPWNYNGFGNKDPGRQRDTSLVKPKHFDALFPTDVDFECAWLVAGTYRLVDLLASLKANLPFNFRYEGNTDPVEAQPSVYRVLEIVIDSSRPRLSTVLSAISESLPDWQITALPGYSIMYREQKTYLSALAMYRTAEKG